MVCPRTWLGSSVACAVRSLCNDNLGSWDLLCPWSWADSNLSSFGHLTWKWAFCGAKCMANVIFVHSIAQGQSGNHLFGNLPRGHSIDANWKCSLILVNSESHLWNICNLISIFKTRTRQFRIFLADAEFWLVSDFPINRQISVEFRSANWDSTQKNISPLRKQPIIIIRIIDFQFWNTYLVFIARPNTNKTYASDEMFNKQYQ